MEPLAVPPASQPIARVDKFVHIWSSHGAAEGCGVGPPYATAGAGGVDVIGSDKGVTVWRPQPPMGYALLGDVLSAGTCCAARITQVIHLAAQLWEPLLQSSWDAWGCCGLLLLVCGFKRAHSCLRLGCRAGHNQPDHQVVAVAISSGLVTYPLGFKRVWESPGESSLESCELGCPLAQHHVAWRHGPAWLRGGMVQPGLLPSKV